MPGGTIFRIVWHYVFMKPLATLFFLLCMWKTTIAQKDSLFQLFVKERFKPVHFSLPEKVNTVAQGKSSFSHFEVLDYRPDTSRIGFAKGPDHLHKELLFKTTASKELAAFLNKFYADPAGAHSMVVIIKRLWLSDIVLNPSEGLNAQVPGKAKISFRVETYTSASSYYIPFTYYDTIITSSKEVLKIAPFRWTVLLQSFMRKVLSVNTETALLKKRLSYTSVDSFSKRSFLTPMDTAQVLQKGVYATFEDFKKNKPSIVDYEIRQSGDSMRELILKDEQGKSYFSRRMWGYCDGQQSYVTIVGNLFPLLRYNHAYYIWGSKVSNSRKHNLLTFFIGAYRHFCFLQPLFLMVYQNHPYVLRQTGICLTLI